MQILMFIVASLAVMCSNASILFEQKFQLCGTFKGVAKMILKPIIYLDYADSRTVKFCI